MRTGIPWLLTALLWSAGGDGGLPEARADWRIDEHVLAHRLYAEGRHGEAAEIFTDPAWKGVALYRSEQWWRAAEAFVRADDPVSAYNLGNCYVKLGYHALALDAYQRALTGDPTFEDARRNAELMRELLAVDDEAAERGGRRSPDDEIDRLENDDEDEAPGGGADGDGDADAGDGSEGERGESNDEPTPSGTDDASASGEPGFEERDESGDGDTGDAVGGDAGAPEDGARPSGTAETEADGAPEDTVGLRAALEAEQATEQWLNRIRQDPARYLEKRIRLEMRRRRAAGQTAPAGGDGW